MKKFENPQMDVSKFDATDVVVTASGPQALNVKGVTIDNVDAQKDIGLYE